MHWMVCSVCYLGCMVVNINVLFAQWRITERDYFQVLLLGILSGMEPTIQYLFSDIDAVKATFHILVNTYFPNFRLALLIVLRALVDLLYLVFFNNFLVFNFPFHLLPIFRTFHKFSYCKLNHSWIHSNLNYFATNLVQLFLAIE